MLTVLIKQLGKSTLYTATGPHEAVMCDSSEGKPFHELVPQVSREHSDTKIEFEYEGVPTTFQELGDYIGELHNQVVYAEGGELESVFLGEGVLDGRI